MFGESKTEIDYLFVDGFFAVLIGFLQVEKLSAQADFCCRYVYFTVDEKLIQVKLEPDRSPDNPTNDELKN